LHEDLPPRDENFLGGIDTQAFYPNLKSEALNRKQIRNPKFEIQQIQNPKIHIGVAHPLAFSLSWPQNYFTTIALA
jgi:hypothetical protein